MKSLHPITLLWCAALCLLLSCADEKKVIPTLEILSNYTTLDNGSITFDSDGGNAAIEICSNVQWRIGCEAEWVTISPRESQGNCEVTISADTTMVARSAVVVVFLSDFSQVRNTFNIIQYAPAANPQPDNGEDNPTDNPDNTKDEEDNSSSGEEDGDSENGDDGESENDAPSEDETDEDVVGKDDQKNDGDDESEGESNTPAEDNDPSNNNGDGGTTPITPPAEDDSETEDDTSKEYSLITTTTKLAAGTYYLGGYQDTTLHLAIEGISNGHCHTATYLYDDKSGSLTPQSAQAIEVTLETTEDTNTYYIRFAGEGYLYATGNYAGQLAFSEEPQHAWKFTADEGGFIVTQDSSFYVKLIIAQYVTDRVLRSIDGYEEGNPIVLFRKN